MTNFLSEFKAFKQDKINVTPCMKFVPHRVENIVGKGENTGNQHIFSISHNTPAWACSCNLFIQQRNSHKTKINYALNFICFQLDNEKRNKQVGLGLG